MTNEEHREHAELIHKFGCSDITAAQLERLAVLDSLGGGGAELGERNGAQLSGVSSPNDQTEAPRT